MDDFDVEDSVDPGVGRDPSEDDIQKEENKDHQDGQGKRIRKLFKSFAGDSVAGKYKQLGEHHQNLEKDLFRPNSSVTNRSFSVFLSQFRYHALRTRTQLF